MGKVTYPVRLVELCVENDSQDNFRNKLYDIPYLMYGVETLKDGSRIVIDKPGGKRTYGKSSVVDSASDDFMVYIHDVSDGSLWLISHDEIKNDLRVKRSRDARNAELIVKALYNVCLGKDPDAVLAYLSPDDCCGIPVETLLKVYKWIWGQEDCNYPEHQGRWMSMRGILKEFDIVEKDIELI